MFGKINSQLLAAVKVRNEIIIANDVDKAPKVFHYTMEGWDILKLSVKHRAVALSSETGSEETNLKN